LAADETAWLESVGSNKVSSSAVVAQESFVALDFASLLCCLRNASAASLTLRNRLAEISSCAEELCVGCGSQRDEDQESSGGF